MENDGENGQKGGSAIHFSESIDQLCNLIISRLEEKWNRGPALRGHQLSTHQARLYCHHYRL